MSVYHEFICKALGSGSNTVYKKTASILTSLDGVSSILSSLNSNVENSIKYDVNRFDSYDTKIDYESSAVMPYYMYDVTGISVGETVSLLFDFHLTGQTGDSTLIGLKSSGGTFMFVSSCSNAPNSHYVGTSTNSSSVLSFGARTSDNHYIAKVVITRLT